MLDDRSFSWHAQILALKKFSAPSIRYSRGRLRSTGYIKDHHSQYELSVRIGGMVKHIAKTGFMLPSDGSLVVLVCTGL
jgi:hypothetical protein